METQTRQAGGSVKSQRCSSSAGDKDSACSFSSKCSHVYNCSGTGNAPCVNIKEGPFNRKHCPNNIASVCLNVLCYRGAAEDGERSLILATNGVRGSLQRGNTIKSDGGEPISRV